MKPIVMIEERMMPDGFPLSDVAHLGEPGCALPWCNPEAPGPITPRPDLDWAEVRSLAYDDCIDCKALLADGMEQFRHGR